MNHWSQTKNALAIAPKPSFHNFPFWASFNVGSHVNSFNQLECFISGQHSYATLKFVYDIGSWPCRGHHNIYPDGDLSLSVPFVFPNIYLFCEQNVVGSDHVCVSHQWVFCHVCQTTDCCCCCCCDSKEDLFLEIYPARTLNQLDFLLWLKSLKLLYLGR